MRCSARVSLFPALLLLGPVMLVAQSASPPAPQTQPWTQIAVPPLHDFKPQQPRRVELPNGLVIFLQEDHELPFINGTILIRGGARDEPAAKTGLVGLYGDTWRTSGTAAISGDALDDQLENKAAHIETSGSTATTSLSWSSLKGDFDTVFAAATDLLLHPAFKPDKLELAKQQVETGIARRNDDVSSIAAREVELLAYGKDNPYGRQVEYTSVAAVTLADFETWHKRTVVPNGMLVAVSGDFDSVAMEKKLRAAFGSLPRGNPIAPAKIDFTGPQPGVYFAEKNDVNQSSISIFGLGTRRDNPDFYALSVMNEIFSGGFGSRVLQNVRTKLGLAYSVGGSFGAAYDHPGLFRVGAGTKSVSTVPATKAVIDEINRLKTDPPTNAEMKSAKDQVLNSFIFRYDAPEKVLSEQVLLQFYGYPADYLDRYKAGVERVTAADVSRVAKQYIDTTKLAILVVGNKEEITPAVETLGKVTTLDISIPPPPPGLQTPPAGPAGQQ